MLRKILFLLLLAPFVSHAQAPFQGKYISNGRYSDCQIELTGSRFLYSESACTYSTIGAGEFTYYPADSMLILKYDDVSRVSIRDSITTHLTTGSEILYVRFDNKNRMWITSDASRKNYKLLQSKEEYVRRHHEFEQSQKKRSKNKK